jgi:hypothetical protein
MSLRARTHLLILFTATLGVALLSGCTPTIMVKPPSEPIVINLNIRHEIIVKVDRDLEDLFEEDDDLF